MMNNREKGGIFDILLGFSSPKRLIPYKSILNISRFNIIPSRNEIDISRKALSRNPDLIILNHENDLDAIRCCLKLKTLSRTSQIPVIILGDTADKQIVLNALKAGASDFIVHSDRSYENLKNRIRKVLSGRRRREEIKEAPASRKAENVENVEKVEKVEKNGESR